MRPLQLNILREEQPIVFVEAGTLCASRSFGYGKHLATEFACSHATFYLSKYIHILKKTLQYEFKLKTLTKISLNSTNIMFVANFKSYFIKLTQNKSVFNRTSFHVNFIKGYLNKIHKRTTTKITITSNFHK